MTRHIIIVPVDDNNPRGATTIYVGTVHSVHKSRKEAQAEFDRLNAEGLPPEKQAGSLADQQASAEMWGFGLFVLGGICWAAWAFLVQPFLRWLGWL